MPAGTFAELHLIPCLLEPHRLETLLCGLENEFLALAHAPEPASEPSKFRTLLVRINLLRGLATQTIRDHVARHPLDADRGENSIEVIARRLEAVHQKVAAMMPGQSGDEEARSLKRFVDLITFGSYVKSIERMTSPSIETIDNQLATLISENYSAPNQQLRHEAVFQLVRQRAKAVAKAELEIPDLAQRLINDRRMADALTRHGVPRAAALGVVAAIRHRDVPHLTVKD